MFTDFVMHYQPTSCRSLILAKCESNELTPPSVVHVSVVDGCTVKQAIYHCYHRLISWRAAFCYCQMCWLLVLYLWCQSYTKQLAVRHGQEKVTFIKSSILYARFCGKHILTIWFLLWGDFVRYFWRVAQMSCRWAWGTDIVIIINQFIVNS